jgi:VIT1/CCC1 family predicted Fe2+/Mn2+ transporter
MRTPLAFVRAHLDAVDRLDEVLFGLIMAVGFTGAFRLGMAESSSRDLFVSIFGCNLAWAIVDGSMYVMSRLHDRGRRERLHRTIVKSPTEEEALRHIACELDGRLEKLTTEGERRQLYRRVLSLLKRSGHDRTRLRREDYLGGLAVAVAIVFTTAPVVAPFLFIEDTGLAVHAANAVAVVLLFWLGSIWGRAVGANPWAVGLGLTLFAMAMVGVTLLLGG